MAKITNFSFPRINLSIGTAWVGRVITVIIQLLGIPILLRYLNANEYAFLMVLISLQAWAMLGDLGISNALQNKIAKQRATGT